MSKDAAYKKLINTARWRLLRLDKLKNHPHVGLFSGRFNTPVYIRSTNEKCFHIEEKRVIG